MSDDIFTTFPILKIEFKQKIIENSKSLHNFYVKCFIFPKRNLIYVIDAIYSLIH